MIILENHIINGKAFIKQYSDKGMMLERDGELYSEAYDLAELGRQYTETDIPIEVDTPTEDEIAEKAKAYDILMGVSE